MSEIRCAECKATEPQHTYWRYCPQCEEYYCGGACAYEHRATCEQLQAKREAGRKWKPFEDGQEKQQACRFCGKPTNHKTSDAFTNSLHAFCSYECFNAYNGPQEQDFQKWVCHTCSKQYPGKGPTPCTCCQQRYCYGCYQRHERGRQQERTYFTYAEESAPFNEEDMEIVFEAFRRADQFDAFRSAFYGYARQSTSSTASTGSAAGTFTYKSAQHTASIPADIAAAYKTLELDTKGTPATEEQIRTAFRTKVKQAADGRGGYKGDMDALTRAKEKALSFLKTTVNAR